VISLAFRIYAAAVPRAGALRLIAFGRPT
jgi:hypothetical protein